MLHYFFVLVSYGHTATDVTYRHVNCQALIGNMRLKVQGGLYTVRSQI